MKLPFDIKPFCISFAALCLSSSWPAPRLVAEQPSRLPGTERLTIEGDISSQLVAGVDKFLLEQIEASGASRAKHWKRNVSSTNAYNHSIAANRSRLAHIVGVRDARITFDAPELMATTERPALIGKGKGFEIFTIRWPAFGDVHGEGLLLVPTGREPLADIVAIPDCNQTPEELVGLAEGTPDESQYARRLAESGCQVIVPVLVNREYKTQKLTYREWLYRSAYQLGRGLIGYEVQKVLACIDWFTKESGGAGKIGIVGWGEGGLIALYAGALDPRVDAVAVSGYFDNREDIWQEPADRNVFGLLEQFGDAELASMIAPRSLVVEAAKAPEATLAGFPGAPSRVVTPALARVRAEFQRAKDLINGLQLEGKWELVVSADGKGPYGTEKAISAFLNNLSPGSQVAASETEVKTIGATPDAPVRLARQVHELDRHNQELLRESQYVRKNSFWEKLNYESLEKYNESVKPFRRLFAEEVIGRFELDLSPPNARSRKTEENDRWTRYEVVMDVLPNVIAYGVLTVPQGIKPGEKRPVVVCQHGLEGRPQDTIGEVGYPTYKAFNTQLAERGFITFSPQNLYIFEDRFRSLQRKANPIKKTLFSIMVPQHQQIVDWLQSLPQVDAEHIGFYGLSYGGKTAMRVPALVTDYSLSICSGDFNDWIEKVASTRNPYSYASLGEYEMFEFDLGGTFSYAEMAALIAPRPFMVERGHFDGVGSDEMVGAEYAKVRHLYAARLHIPERTEIEWFVGPHTINGVGTYRFLHKHLHLPATLQQTAAQ
jgi:dienelactone hydrolase